MRILLVEDEALIAMDIADTLLDAGHTIAGPAATVAQARQLIETDDAIAFALLDVNLRGEASYPIADLLLERGVPFVFTSGYGPAGLDARYRAYRTLSKPVSREALIQALSADGPAGASPPGPNPPTG